MPDIDTQLVPAVDPARDRLKGGGESAVTLVEFGDYECPYSRAAYRSVQVLERQLGSRLRFVFRHFPLAAIHPHAVQAALAAEAAAEQGRFWEMHDQLFHHQKALEREDLEAYARELGLDRDRFGADVTGGPLVERIRADVASGERSGVQGTPTLFIDGRRYDGSYRVDQLREALVGASGPGAAEVG